MSEKPLNKLKPNEANYFNVIHNTKLSNGEFIMKKDAEILAFALNKWINALPPSNVPLSKAQWPEKKRTDETNETGEYYKRLGWNSCHDAFMQVINALPSSKPLSLEEIVTIIKNCIHEEVKNGYREGGVYPEIVAQAIYDAQPSNGMVEKECKKHKSSYEYQEHGNECPDCKKYPCVCKCSCPRDEICDCGHPNTLDALKEGSSVGEDIRADGKPYKVSDYRAKTIMEDFARQVNKHGFSAGGQIDNFIKSIINWKNDCAKLPPASQQVPLDEYELYKILSDYAILPTHAVNIPDQRRELSKFICSKFAQPSQVPSVEEIEEVVAFKMSQMVMGNLPDHLDCKRSFVIAEAIRKMMVERQK